MPFNLPDWNPVSPFALQSAGILQQYAAEAAKEEKKRARQYKAYQEIGETVFGIPKDSSIQWDAETFQDLINAKITQGTLGRYAQEKAESEQMGRAMRAFSQPPDSGPLSDLEVFGRGAMQKQGPMDSGLADYARQMGPSPRAQFQGMLGQVQGPISPQGVSALSQFAADYSRLLPKSAALPGEFTTSTGEKFLLFGEHAPQRLGKPERTAQPIEIEAQIEDFEKQARDAYKSGNIEEGNNFKLRAGRLTAALKGKSLKVTFDSENRISDISYGDEEGISKTTQSRLERQLLGMEQSATELQRLQKDLRPGDVGLWGTVGEEAIDKLGAQLVPGWADLQRADNRTRLKAVIQGMVRQISTEPDRFSNEDRKTAEAVLMQKGWDESYPRTMQVISTLLEIFGQRAQRDASELKREQPAWSKQSMSLSVDEIAERVRRGWLSEDQGAFLIYRYHPEALK